VDELKIIDNVLEGAVKICRIMGTGIIEGIFLDFCCFSFKFPGRGVCHVDPTIVVVAPPPLTIVVGTSGRGRSRTVFCCCCCRCPSYLCMCVCVSASGYGGVTVKHVIPIASAPLNDIPSIPWGSYYYPSGPLVGRARGVFNLACVSWM
jgi:hypothetical protein